ncbi:alkaline phosphatase family protein [Horticoccus luteus]|uniref:Alkaline phosphatase family protein n=1 Tax=Horticoccus luteus TaxID=2862869 RepID=A0A8F9XIT9_9BACT|nr:alkaline phosphatase family protein [Horticoccus luteus]QYM77948.1 alkaline phosphatase family protein [Horticoccus luteus]
MLLAGVFSASAGTKEAPPPALVVVISIDQFRHDYLERFAPYFGREGFRRLQEQGADFVDCHFRHSITYTGPGHAVMLTGVHANVGGIIANEWLEGEEMTRVNCVEDRSVSIIGQAAGDDAPAAVTAAKGRSPAHLLADTVGDELKMARANRPRVIGVSNKDRAAILMSGKLADAAYWMEGGRVVSSTYYGPKLPAWLVAFNAEGRVEKYFNRVWDRALPEKDYALQDVDDMAGESDGLGLTRVFPHRITGGADRITPAFYSAFNTSPFSLEFLTDLAVATLRNEQLGQRGTTDVLTVSYSATDYVGHAYGPDSQEMMDMVVRLDGQLARLLAAVDQQVGLAHCTIVLTADHGAAPTPEHIHAISPHFDAGRFDGGKMTGAAEQALIAQFGPAPADGHWVVRDGLSLRLVAATLRARHVAANEAQRVAAEAVAALPFVQAVYTRTQLERGEVHDELGARMLLSFNAARSGDVLMQPKPFWIDKTPAGTTHGSPYNYDTHVPMLWFGVGVKPGRYVERVGVDDIAPTLARILGVPAPPRAEGRVLF